MSTLPPDARTALWQPISAAAGRGEFVLQVCADCGTVQYPPREVCGECLGGTLNYQPVDPRGRLLSWSDLHASLEPFFQQRAPWRIASVKLDCGPVVLVQFGSADPQAGARVVILNRLNESGQSTLVVRAAKSQ